MASKRLERLVIWIGAMVGGVALLYIALTAKPTDLAAWMLGVLVVLGFLLTAIGVFGLAAEVVGWVNCVLPDPVETPRVPDHEPTTRPTPPMLVVTGRSTKATYIDPPTATPEAIALAMIEAEQMESNTERERDAAIRERDIAVRELDDLRKQRSGESR